MTRAWETDAFQDEMLDLAGVNTLLSGTNGNTEPDNMHEQRAQINLKTQTKVVDYTFCFNPNLSIESLL